MHGRRAAIQFDFLCKCLTEVFNLTHTQLLKQAGVVSSYEHNEYIPERGQYGTACSALSHPAAADSATYATRASMCEGRLNFRGIAFQHSREEVYKAPSFSDAIDLLIYPCGVKGTNAFGVGFMKVLECLWK